MKILRLLNLFWILSILIFNYAILTDLLLTLNSRLIFTVIFVSLQFSFIEFVFYMKRKTNRSEI